MYSLFLFRLRTEFKFDIGSYVLDNRISKLSQHKTYFFIVKLLNRFDDARKKMDLY